MTQENKISAESAKLQIDNWLEYYGLDFADIEIEDGEEAAKTLMNTLTRAIQKGTLDIKVEEDLQVIHHLVKPIGDLDIITYQDKVSRARIAMDKVKSKHAQERMYSFMAVLCAVPVATLTKLKGADATIFTRISTVFSMV